MAASVLAPAKVNLALHVTGRRSDGYHTLDTLVAFADDGDRLSIRPARTTRLRVTGPERAGVPTGPGNLVLRALELAAGGRGADVTLEKQLPAAAGIGGGSADAAAVLRAAAALWPGPPPDPADVLALGADVPMCVEPQPQIVSGIGDVTRAVRLPPLPAVLANPRLPVPTAEVFEHLGRRENRPLPALPPAPSASELVRWLAGQRNDLTEPARALCPAVAEVLAALGSLPGCLLARMSGSGATCFGLFADTGSATAAAGTLRRDRPDWWIRAVELGDATRAARPVFS